LISFFNVFETRAKKTPISGIYISLSLSGATTTKTPTQTTRTMTNLKLSKYHHDDLNRAVWIDDWEPDISKKQLVTGYCRYLTVLKLPLGLFTGLNDSITEVSICYTLYYDTSTPPRIAFKNIDDFDICFVMGLRQHHLCL